jgi:thioredoxin-related protein/uncharacterized protein YlbG (UPF0298 family)
MIDKIELKKWWDTFVGDGNFTEIRILGKFQYSGYFKSFDNLCAQIEPYSNMDDEQIYFVLNQIDSSCYARPQCEKFIKSVKVSTNDNDIIRRKFLMIDCDAIRKSSTNSSDVEFNAALQKARDIFRFLRVKGFPDPIVCTSGNGAHLQIPVDLPNDEETTEIIKRFYKYLGSQFTDSQVDIDQKVYNLARLCKTYSTVAKKGANLPERPWRKAEIIYIPQTITNTSIEKIKEIADMLPPEEPKQVQNRPNRQYNNAPFDLRTWLNEHSIVYKEEQHGNSTKFVLQHCPWEDTHSSKKEWESALFQNSDGQITFSCFHSHCSDKTWFDFRQVYEPDAYSKPAYQPTQYGTRQYAPQKPKYEIKDEIPELGEKWLSMSSIKKVDLSGLEHVKTGFTELDKSIVGLYMSEVTILSGNNGSGKSSWLNSLLLNIINQGTKVALWSGELRPDILKAWIQMSAAGKANLLPSQYGDGKYFVPNGVSARIDSWMDGKFFLYNNEYGAHWEQIFHDMELLLKAGVKVFALDNLFSLDIDILDGDKNSKQKDLILQIKEFAKKNMVHIILVAHPRKTTAFLRKNDIAGSADLQNAVDKIFCIHRVNNDFFRTGAEFFGQTVIQKFQGYGNTVEVMKERLFGVVDLMVGMHYEIESRRFLNYPTERIVYGWETVEQQPTITYPEQESSDGYVPIVSQSQMEQFAQSMPFEPPTNNEATPF